MGESSATLRAVGLGSILRAVALRIDVTVDVPVDVVIALGAPDVFVRRGQAHEAR
jgi:hypothetical protein